MELFERAAEIAKGYIKTWLPGGQEESGQWVVCNPHRDDRTAGSFKINLITGAFRDYADDDCVGRDAVTLYAWLNGMRNIDAAREILAKYDPSYFPSAKDNWDIALSWHQLTKGHKSSPVFETQKNEVTRWNLEIPSSKAWRTVMIIVRYVNNGKKSDIPYTLWTDGKAFEWRPKALHGVKYPLYGLRALTEKPNARVILYEGQKTASVVQRVMGDDWVCVGWYGGAGNSNLTDFSPLLGREVWYSFDADSAGRKAITGILEESHAKIHLVYPPVNSPKGWDHADAVEQGYTKEQIEALLFADSGQKTNLSLPVPACSELTPDNRPSSLDELPDATTNEYILSAIFQNSTNKDGEMERKLSTNWTSEIVDADNVLGTSIKYDYTTGIEATAYDNNNLYVAALEERLRKIGVPLNVVTRSTTEKIMRSVIRLNSNYNRVADYLSSLSSRYPGQTEAVLDSFINMITFHVPQNDGESIEAHEKRSVVVEGLYRELFDKFFTRMHAHVNGTRRTAGDYRGLIENDIVPIFSGPQGCGKTTLCHWIACDDELYADLGSGLKAQFGSAETIKKVRGKLLVEIGEMKVMKNTDSIETIKSFISQKAVDVDIKYVENQRQIPMTASYAGTDNEGQYLCDNTGNRRFWPVLVKAVDMELMAKDPELKYRLHAYYQQKTQCMTNAEVFAYCTPSKELDAFIAEQRQEALVTYSDYEACCAVIKEWMTNPLNYQKELNQAAVEMMAHEKGYMMRIGQRSCKRAFADCGMVLKRVKSEITGVHTMAWINEGGRGSADAGKYNDEIPF